MLQTGAKARQVISIGITNQRETVVAWDRETGKPVGPAIVWQCRRTSSFCELLKKRIIRKRSVKSQVLFSILIFQEPKMRWILKNNTEARKLAGKSRLCFGTVDSFLVWKLTGGKSFVTDVSNASRTLLMDLKTLDYSDEMLKLFDLKKEMLPAIQPSSGIFWKNQQSCRSHGGNPHNRCYGGSAIRSFWSTLLWPGRSENHFWNGKFPFDEYQEPKNTIFQMVC